MGLDMNLVGRKSVRNREEDGFKVNFIELQLSYWCKHPDLHGYIMNKYGGPVNEDGFPFITLYEARILDIIDAVKTKRLPETTGPYFGQSHISEDQIADDVQKLEAALTWERAALKYEGRVVYYTANW